MSKKEVGAIEKMYRRARLPELIGESTWSSIEKSFHEDEFDRWVDGLERLIAAEAGASAVINLAQASIVSAKHFGAEAALGLVPATLAIRRHAGNRHWSMFLASVPRAS